MTRPGRAGPQASISARWASTSSADGFVNHDPSANSNVGTRRSPSLTDITHAAASASSSMLTSTNRTSSSFNRSLSLKQGPQVLVEYMVKGTAALCVSVTSARMPQ